MVSTPVTDGADVDGPGVAKAAGAGVGCGARVTMPGAIGDGVDRICGAGVGISPDGSTGASVLGMSSGFTGGSTGRDVGCATTGWAVGVPGSGGDKISGEGEGGG